MHIDGQAYFRNGTFAAASKRFCRLTKDKRRDQECSKHSHHSLPRSLKPHRLAHRASAG